MPAPIVCIKLFNGEELIAKVSAAEPNYMLTEDKSTHHSAEDLFNEKTLPWSIPPGRFVLKDVYSVSVTPTGTGNMALSLLPWMMANYSADTVIDLERHAIAVFPPIATVEDNYVQQTTTLDLSSAKGGGLAAKMKL